MHSCRGNTEAGSPFLQLTIKCQLETSMAETSKSTTKDKAAKTKKETHKEQEKLLNRELEDSFPASDPPSLTQPTTEMGVRIVSATRGSKAGAESDPGSAFTTAALPDKRASNPQGAPRKRRVAEHGR